MKSRVAPGIPFAALAAAAAWRVAAWPEATSPDVVDDEVVSPVHDDEPILPSPHASVYPAMPSSPPAEVAEAADVPALESLDVGRVRWPMPRDQDFETAREVGLAHQELNDGDSSNEPPSCVARELRGWLRLTCTRPRPSVSVLGGSTNGLVIAADEQQLTVTMPLAPGDCRVLQLARIGSAYWEGDGLIADGVLSETWIGTTGPHVTIHEPQTPMEL